MKNTFRVYPVSVKDKGPKSPPVVRFRRACWFDVKLHKSVDEYRKARGNDSFGSFVPPERFLVKVNDWGRTTNLPKGRIGTLHFRRDKMAIQLIAHECTHAMFHLARMIAGGIELIGPNEVEELWAYNLQYLVQQVTAELVKRGCFDVDAML